MGKKPYEGGTATAAPPPAEKTVNSGNKSPKHDKTFCVKPLGQNAQDAGLSPMTISNCCDESEAIRCYCAKRQILPNKYRFSVTGV